MVLLRTRSHQADPLGSPIRFGGFPNLKPEIHPSLSQLPWREPESKGAKNEVSEEGAGIEKSQNWMKLGTIKRTRGKTMMERSIEDKNIIHTIFQPIQSALNKNGAIKRCRHKAKA